VARSLSHGLQRGAAAALLLAAASAGNVAWAQPLTVCMAEDNAPLSYKVGRQAGAPLRGLDVRIAEALAAELGRPLKLLPFETEYEKESTLAQEVGALLAAGLCDAASGFALLAGDLGAPQRPNARAPDYPGAPRKRERPFIPLQPTEASRAYMAVALGLLQREGATPAAGLAELATQRLGVAAGTLAGSVAMGWNGGALRHAVRSLSQREDPVTALAERRVDAVLLPLAHIDGLRRHQPGLVVSPWRKPIGLNLGFVTLQSSAGVREAINRVITRALADGSLARWAAEEGVSYTPPQPPDVRSGLSMQVLLAE
jgi:ABC-type amino acid transport substrate-binding protein